MVAISADRVTGNTAPEVNAQIRRRAEMSLAYFADHPDQIDRRLRELDAEWDIERVVETQSAALSLVGLTLSFLTGRRRWLLVPIAVQGFMLQHALQGWCPPVPVLRRLGVRTREEIDRERYALKLLRGDFRGAGNSDAAQSAGGVQPLIDAIDR